MRCKNCGGVMIGDGYTEPIRCENVDFDISTFECDCKPIECKDDKDVREIKMAYRWRLIDICELKVIMDCNIEDFKTMEEAEQHGLKTIKEKYEDALQGLHEYKREN